MVSSESGFKKHFADNNALTLKSAHTPQSGVGGGGRRTTRPFGRKKRKGKKKVVACGQRKENVASSSALFELSATC